MSLVTEIPMICHTSTASLVKWLRHLQTINGRDGASSGCHELIVVALISLRIHLHPVAAKCLSGHGGHSTSCHPLSLGLILFSSIEPRPNSILIIAFHIQFHSFIFQIDFNRKDVQCTIKKQKNIVFHKLSLEEEYSAFPLTGKCLGFPCRFLAKWFIWKKQPQYGTPTFKSRLKVWSSHFTRVTMGCHHVKKRTGVLWLKFPLSIAGV